MNKYVSMKKKFAYHFLWKTYYFGVAAPDHAIEKYWRFTQKLNACILIVDIAK